MRIKKIIATLILATGVAFAIAQPSATQPLDGKRSSAEIIADASPSDWRTLDPENLLYIDLERGRIVVELSAHFAPAHVMQTKTLASQGFYDGLNFYRVIDGFVAQGGDLFEGRDIGDAAAALSPEFSQPLTKAMGFFPMASPDGYAAKVGFVESLPVGVDETGKHAWLLHCTGAFAFGRNNEPDTASTEFYVTLQPQRYLDRNLTVAGRVVKGMEHLQALRRVSPAESPDGDLGETILSIRIAADVPEADREELQILDSSTEVFADYVEARRNRPEAFFVYRPDHINICQLPMPVRAKPSSEATP